MKANFILVLLAAAALHLQGTAQANQNLSNLLSPTSVNQHLLPNTDNTKDLGSVSKSWRNVYMDGYLYLDGSRFISNPASNMAVGVQAGNINMTGSQNTFIGSNSGFSMSSGNYNTFTGSFAGYLNSTGSENTFIGEAAGNLNGNGSYNTFVGRRAGYSNSSGYGNSTLGRYALYSNTTGYYNSAVGYDALYSNVVGVRNSAFGYKSLFSSDGTENAAFGNTALYYNKGSFNSAFGSEALYSNINGDWNSAFGDLALYHTTDGNWNSALGNQALYYNTTGNYNSALGEGAGFNSASGDNNIFIGSSSGTSDPACSNSTALGHSASVTASNQVRIGNGSVTSIGGYSGWTNISDGRVKKNIKENVPGLSFINKLKPVTYNLDLTAADKITRSAERTDKGGRIIPPSQGEIAARKVKEQIVYTGFIAQEVEAAAKDLNYDFSGVDVAKNDKDLYGLRYAEFVVPLVKAVQELDESQKSEVKSQNEEIAKLKKDYEAKIGELEKEIDELRLMIVSGNQLTEPGGQSAMSNQLSVISGASLQQNIPNPFNRTTTINYNLPQQYSSAKIIITDKLGKTLKEINVSGAGKGSLQVDASALASGAYKYSLLVTGKLVGTKQMVLAK